MFLAQLIWLYYIFSPQEPLVVVQIFPGLQGFSRRVSVKCVRIINEMLVLIVEYYCSVCLEDVSK